MPATFAALLLLLQLLAPMDAKPVGALAFRATCACTGLLSMQCASRDSGTARCGGDTRCLRPAFKLPGRQRSTMDYPARTSRALLCCTLARGPLRLPRRVQERCTRAGASRSLLQVATATGRQAKDKNGVVLTDTSTAVAKSCSACNGSCKQCGAMSVTEGVTTKCDTVGGVYTCDIYVSKALMPWKTGATEGISWVRVAKGPCSAPPTCF